MNEVKQRNERDMATVQDVVSIAASTALTNSSRTVLVTILATGTLTITLPPVAGSNGQELYIHMLARGANYSNGTVTIVDKGDSIVAVSIASIATADDYVILKSNGLCWYSIAQKVT